MEKVIVEKIRALLDDEQLRLNEVVRLFVSISNLPSFVLEKKLFLSLFSSYIKDYSNLVNVYTLYDLCENFSNFSGIQLSVIGSNRLDNKSGDLFVKFETYRLLYFQIWPEYVRALRRKYIKEEKITTFKYNIPKKKVKEIYNEGNAIRSFFDEIIGLANINGFDATGINNEDFVTLEMEI